MRAADAIKFAMLEDASRWTVKDVALLLLGAVISFYATAVFERYKRFGEMLRNVARNRELSLEYLSDLSLMVNLEIAYRRMDAFHELLAETTWSLEADGHEDAAKKMAHLQSFIKRAAGCVGHMMSERTSPLTAKQYLEEFMTEYQDIFNANFQRFEEQLRPSWKALLRLFPHGVLPEQRVANEFDYFDELLKMKSEAPRMHL